MKELTKSINEWRLELDDKEYPVYVERGFYGRFHDGTAGITVDDVRLLGLLLILVDREKEYALTNAHDLYLLRGGDDVQSIQRALVRLTKHGWITRTKVEGDGCYSRITVSPKYGVTNLKDREYPEVNHDRQ